jgi:predicted transcriptional regulator of viral defense system
MKYIEILRKFQEKKIKYFSLEDFQIITDSGYNAARAILQRYKKKGLVVNPKRGFYFFKDYPPNEYELANRLYFPSYISMETVLSRHGVIPETIYPIISITTKPTRKFICQNQEYLYHKIKKEAFTGYVKKGDFLIAETEKALADYLYFVALGQKNLNSRVNLKNINKTRLRQYGKLFQNPKLLNLIENA